MKFRTELSCRALPRPIDHTEQIITLGSCFADEVGRYLSHHKFCVVSNPMGPLFNPFSICSLIERTLDKRPYTEADVAQNSEGQYILFDHSTAYSSPNAEQLIAEANERQKLLHEALLKADHLLLTFGTAWVYRHIERNHIVANCHKLPQRLFARERLHVESIVERIVAIAERLPHTQVVVTVSPIRHLGDGLEGNAVSKSILRLAADECVARCERVHYFPSYELLVDDLRDYRFYADDLCHPSAQAVRYICERFAEAAFTPETRSLNEEVERLTAFVAHRPHNPHSELYHRSVADMIDRMERSKIDFSTEITALKARL